MREGVWGFLFRNADRCLINRIGPPKPESPQPLERAACVKSASPIPVRPPPAFGGGTGSVLVEGLFFPCEAETKNGCFAKLSPNGGKGDADLGLAALVAQSPHPLAPGPKSKGAREGKERVITCSAAGSARNSKKKQ